MLRPVFTTDMDFHPARVHMAEDDIELAVIAAEFFLVDGLCPKFIFKLIYTLTGPA